jgi:hypothetical protein
MISLKMIPFVNYKTLPVMAFLEFFLDAGQANSRNRDFFTSNKLYGSYLYSTGLSLQMLFYNDRLVRFEYSLNAEGNSGFYFHFKKAI